MHLHLLLELFHLYKSGILLCSSLQMLAPPVQPAPLSHLTVCSLLYYDKMIACGNAQFSSTVTPAWMQQQNSMSRQHGHTISCKPD